MAAPNYEQVQSFSKVRKDLYQAAVDEFMGELTPDMTAEEIMEEAARIAAKFKMYGSELGAQWYDLCAELAGVDAELADIEPFDYEHTAELAKNAYKSIPANKPLAEFFGEFITDQIRNSINETGMNNLYRDYGRGVRGGRWARVPVGETCAICIMFASQGAWYLTRESALREEAGHFHRGCDCTAVYYANADDLEGYSGQLAEYKDMYYQAANRRIAARNGKNPYPDELAERIATAKANHNRREEEKAQEALERGEDYEKIPWRTMNEDAILMREMFGLK